MRSHIVVSCLVVFAMTPACKCGPDSMPDGGMGGGTGGGGSMGGGGGMDAGTDSGVPYDEFDAWREIQQVLRASPDAVPARAEALVAARDARGLFELVRDDIALLPTNSTGFFDANAIIRWGPRATLRGQAGTPRERAELLRSLLLRAGFNAEVVVGTPEVGATVTALLAHGPQRRARYDLPPALLTKWDATLPLLPVPYSQDFKQLDADGGVRARVLAAIEPLLPPAPMVPAFDATITEVPLVRLVIDGGTLYANPNIDGAQFGESKTSDTPDVPPQGYGERTLHLTLMAARSGRPEVAFPLLDKTFNASDIASRTVTVAFTTPLTRGQASKTRVGDVNAFIPGDGVDDTLRESLSAIGTPVLRDGTRIERADGGGLLVEGELLAPSPTSNALLSSVATLNVAVSAAAFPDVELLVSARNAANVAVADLGADAFVITEGDAGVVASLRRTHVSPPRVVLLFDRSTSIPMEFLAGAPTVGHNIADAIFTQFPGSEVQIAAIDINGPTISGGFVSTLTDVDTQLGMLSGTGSEVWTSVDAFAESGASAVVVITDAEADDMPLAAMLTRLNRGPPLLIAGVGTVNAATANRLADVSNGLVLAGVTDMNLPMQVAQFIAQRQLADYRIVYRAPPTGPSPRVVQVKLRAPSTVVGTRMYDPPAMPVAPSALSALYLVIETDGRSVTRTLAGGPSGTAAEIEEVAGALFGRWVLDVQAGQPSLSTLLNDVLSERLELEQANDAVRAGDLMAIAEANKRTYFRVPRKLRFGGAAAPEDEVSDDFTFVDGLTVTMHATLPRLGQKMVRRYDLIPLAPRQTIALSGGNPFALTMQRTALLAAYEAGFAKNTFAALNGKTLALFDSTSIEMLGPQWVGFAYPTYDDYHLLAPADGSVLAAWAVHRTTGEIIGIMPEGGPGEDESTEALVNRLLTILDAAGRAGEATGYNGVKVWADLEATKVQLLGGVIALFEGEGTTGDIAGNLCGAGIDALGGPIPGFNTFNMPINDLNSIYRGGGVILGHDFPQIPNATSVICGGILGP